MPASSLHIILYNWLKPFLDEAKNKGFHVSPDTHIKIVAVLSQCADKIEDETVLFDYFSPLVAKNKEDYYLLKGEWEKWCGREKLTVTNKTDEKEKTSSYLWVIASIGCLALLFTGWFVYNRYVNIDIAANYIVSYTDVTQPVQFDASASFKNKKDTSDVMFVWNYGDGNIDTSANVIVLHTYDKPKLYNSSLTLVPRSSRTVVFEPEMKTPFTLCKPKLRLTQQPEDNLLIHQRVRFAVAYDSSFPSSGRNEWKINGNTVARDEASIATAFDSAGTQTITYIDRDYNAGSACDSTTETTATVKSSSALEFTVRQSSAVPALPLQVNRKSMFVLITFLLYLLVHYFINRKKQKKKNSETATRSDDVITKLKGTKPPYEIPFTNKDDSIDDEPLLPALVKNFKRRIADENVYLNLPLTISSTVKSEGFLLPVFTQKTKPAEYLILIDKSNVKSAQVKLFEYLIKRFAKSDIYIETFYFYDKPEYGFNAYYPRGIYISRLYDLYPDHTVIIFGNGYSFIDKYYPALNEATTLPYTKWTNRSIFTPVPYNDWGGKEILLQKSFLLLPADMEGQLLLFNFIEKPEINAGEDLQPLQSLYKTKGFNANKAEKLKKYLDNEFLFQWLCALAISPSIYWQTMIGIGDALQKERYQNEVILYSSLLKLVRISWMRDAAFPEEVRLDLLKQLEPHNEKIARQIMISMMQEAALKTDENSFAYEELYLQQMTDKFMLYAHDANNEKFEVYKTAYDEFKALWKNDKIKDVVLKEYLKKEDGGEWSTLIGNTTLLPAPQASVSINSLFDDSITASQEKRLKRINNLLFSLMALTAFFIVSLYLFKKEWNGTSLNGKLKLVSVDTSATVPFIFNVVYNECLYSAQRKSDSTILILDFGDNNILQLSVDDTAKQKNIPYAWLNKRQAALHVSSRNEAYNFDSSFVITSNQMSLSLSGCAVNCNRWKPKQPANLETLYTGDWYENSIVNGTNSTYIPVHIEPRSINGETIKEVAACENNGQLLRIITQNNNGGFGLYYLSQTQTGAIGFAKQTDVYGAIDTAEKDSSSFNLTPLMALLTNATSFASSHSFFTTFNGQWKTDNNEDLVDINSAQNIITLDNKYTFSIVAEQQIQTTWGKPLYKLSVLQNGAATKKSNLYFLLLDSARGFVSGEEQDSGAIHYTMANMGTFERMHKQSETAETPAALPQSLNEIWRSGTSDRLVTLFLPKNVIYVSTNDVQMYNSYNIDKVLKLSDGSFKIIAKANGRYKLFFLKNISSTSFDLSICPDFATEEQATGKTAADCDRFTRMNLYYENDPSLIYLPVSFSNTLAASQKAKLNKVVTSINNKTATVTGFDVELSYTPPNLSNTVASMNSFLQRNGISNSIKNTDVHSSNINRPFTRSYIAIKTIQAANISATNATDNNNSVKQEAYTETDLGDIEFDEKNVFPDTKSLRLIEAITRQLNKDTASRIRLKVYYTSKTNYRAAQQNLNVIINIFRKDGVHINKAGTPMQIITLLQMGSAPSQNNNPISQMKVSINERVTFVVTGINFPVSFNPNNQRAE